MKTHYGGSPWVSNVPASRRPSHPRLRGELESDVVIIGGGLTGLATAHACAMAGLDVVLVERDRLAAGSSGSSPGLLLAEPAASFRDIVGARGLRGARHVLEAWRKGAADGAALLRRLRVRCALEDVQDFVAASVADERDLRRDVDARTAAGLDARWLTARRVAPVLRQERVVGAARRRDGFTLDPYRASLGIAAAARRRGARLFEHTAALAVVAGRAGAEVRTDGGTIQAANVVVATGAATPLFKPLQRHFQDVERYCVQTEPLPAPMRKALPAESVTFRDAGVPFRVRWAAEHRLLIAGADGPPAAERSRGSVLVQRAGQLMYELLTRYPEISGLRPDHAWHLSGERTTDGSMVVGPHRNYPHHLFALGGDESVTGAFVAARIVVRALRHSPDKADAAFDWSR